MLLAIPHDSTIISRAKAALLDVLFPDQCAGCGTEGLFCCERCVQSLYLLSLRCVRCGRAARREKSVVSAHTAGRPCRACSRHTLLARFYAPYRYEGLVRLLLHRLKFGRSLGVAGFFAGAVQKGLERERVEIPNNALLVPVPLSGRRRRRRGFNQSEAIARHLGMLTGVPVATEVITRVRDTPPQVSLPASARMRNMTDAFAVPSRISLIGRTVCLVDDVRTTGATLEAAAAALRSSGAVEIWALTAAQTF